MIITIECLMRVGYLNKVISLNNIVLSRVVTCLKESNKLKRESRVTTGLLFEVNNVDVTESIESANVRAEANRLESMSISVVLVPTFSNTSEYLD